MQNDCELARDRDLGLAEPVALDELHPQAFTADHFGTRVLTRAVHMALNSCLPPVVQLM